MVDFKVVYDQRQSNHYMNNPPAVLLGFESMQGLQTARILAGYQIPVTVIGRDPDHPNWRTNVCQAILHVAPGSEALVKALVELGPTLSDKAVLFPCKDSDVSVVSQHREMLAPWYHIVLPPHDVVNMLADKVHFAAFCQENGLPIPKTFVLTTRAEAEAAAASLNYPCVLKPPHRTVRWIQATDLKAFRIENSDALLDYFDKFIQVSDTLLVQEWIFGTDADLYSFNGYFDRSGVPQATFIARKIRQWPPETGQSCLGIEVRADEVLETALDLFQRIEYSGLAYVEMKKDHRDGRYYLVEPNIGRPTGRSAIAEAGGVPLIYTMYCDAIGRLLPPNREQRYGNVKWIYWRRDILSALHYWRRGELTLSEWWRSVRGPKTCAVFSWRDPGPFLADLRHTLTILLSPSERRRRDPSKALHKKRKLKP